MSERTSLASLVFAGVTLLVAASIGLLRRPAETVGAGLIVGAAVWLIDWLTEVRAVGRAESIQAEDAQAAGA